MDGIIDKAIALIPGAGKPKRVRKQVSPQARLAALQKNLAALTRDVEKLSSLIAGQRKPRAAKTAATGRQKSRGRSRAQAKRSSSARTQRAR
jgi:hypothetical protein